MPLISIIIVTFNRIELFQKCIETVLQTTSHLDREIIVWDNCSTDGTKAFLELLTKRESITVIYNDNNIGINAKGMAIRQTTGDYIVGVDDDVISLPEHWAEKMIVAFN
jgi:glycosyltransferase involved in cell wall biosynthesis